MIETILWILAGWLLLGFIVIVILRKIDGPIAIKDWVMVIFWGPISFCVVLYCLFSESKAYEKLIDFLNKEI
jgi:hypothetical protein